jgi:hypothetical protein
VTTESDDEHEPDATDALTPGIEGMPTPEDDAKSDTKQEADWMDWLLPDDSDTDGDGRTGFLSTYTEVHALVFGVTAGAHFALSGEAQLINDVVGLATLGDRTRQAKKLDGKYREQAKEELPHFIAGVAIGYIGARSDVLAGTGIGV